jgi:hypothetical protein
MATAPLTLDQYDSILEQLPRLYANMKAARAKLAAGSAGTDDMQQARGSRHNDIDDQDPLPYDTAQDKVGMDAAYFADAPGRHKDSMYGVKPAPERLGPAPRGFDTQFPDASRIRSV